MKGRSRSLGLAIVLCGLALASAACQSAALQANQAQVQQQQEQIEQMQKQIAELKAQQNYSLPPPPPGSCDKEVMARATQQGGEKYASGDFSEALGYYQDALTACPENARAELNVGRTYEALNDRSQATAHYRQAASSGDPSETAAETEARTAIARLGSTSQ
jgi:tetratricopeptide (TPR) repeat protein